MIKTKLLHLSMPIVTFLTITTIIGFLYVLASNKHHSVIKEQVEDTGEILTKEFNQQFESDLSKLRDLKRRLEFTGGAYFSNWEFDAKLLLEQSTSFNFIEWIDSTMIIKKIVPIKGNEAALNLDISTIDYRTEEWIKHIKNGETNITPWVELTQKGKSFIIDVPVYFNNNFQGTISAGLDFTERFDRIVDYLDNQYVVELFDDQGTLFYSVNKDKKLKTKKGIFEESFINVDSTDNQKWHLMVYPSEDLLLAEGKTIINAAFIIGLFLSVLTTFLVYFYFLARKGKKIAFDAYSKLIETNKILNLERNRAEKASQAKTDFLSNMSHEIRTPLHAILGFIELIKDSNLSKTNKEYLSLMEKSSSNLLHIVNDILDIEKIESGKLVLNQIYFNPKKTIKELIKVNKFIFLGKNLFLKGDFEKDSGFYVIGDETKLVQIINNILKNALKFTNEGGITLTYREFKTIDNKLNIIIAIKDTGIGMPKSKLNSIFERFTQIENSVKKNYAGSGLGLYISKIFVTMMGGQIKVKSEPKIGTEFQFNIIFPVVNKQKKAVLNGSKSIRFSDVDVLIVDDNKVNVMVLKKFLEDFGISPETASNGVQAIDKYNTYKPQLIFMDIHMPEMDGWEATKEIRKMDKNVIIFGLSANVTTEAMDKGITSGMNNYLTKPFKKEQLKKLLNFHFKN